MPIKQLSDDQIRSMSLEEKDRWWLENIFKGDMPQLTIRSAITGMTLGTILSLTNLYIGIKTGWTLGVGITSVILAFSLFKLISRLNVGSEITLLENNAMQSIATAAGYMTGPLVSSVTAYMMVTGHIIPMDQTIMWVIALALMGVLVAFPLKRRFINDEQLPFPEGRAAGIVMDDLHHAEVTDGPFKMKLLGVAAGISALIEFMSDKAVMTFVGWGVLSLPDHWDEFIYQYFTPRIMGTPLKELTITLETSIVMIAAGGLMGIKTGLSLLIGALLNYGLLAPIMIDQGIIQGTGFKYITMWSLWGGVAMMTTASLTSFFAKPQMVVSAMRKMFIQGGGGEQDMLKDIELPNWLFVVGVPVLGIIIAFMGHAFFGIRYWLVLVAIPLTFVFTIIAVYSTGLTSITPTGALGKLTQLTFSVLAPGNVKTNVMTAGITGEVASNASNLLMDIKPGYMLGGKPRHQAAGHCLGIVAGACVSIPVYYLLLHGDLSLFGTELFPMPAAQVWAAVAKVLTKGLSFLHVSAQWAIAVGAVLGIVFEVVNIRMKGRFPLSGVGMGLAFVIPFDSCLSMFLGAFIFWLMKKFLTDPNSRWHGIFVANQETVCAGAIAGGAMIGIMLAVLNQVVFV